MAGHLQINLICHESHHHDNYDNGDYDVDDIDDGDDDDDVEQFLRPGCLCRLW